MKWTTKGIRMLLIIVLLFTFSAPQAAAQPFQINAKSAVLIDQATGTVIYEKNQHDPLPPASVTKIMTMLLAMEAIDSNRITLNDKVTISDLASSMGGTQLYLEPGEEKTVEELMKGIAIRSANDASVAIGEHISGTEELFVQRMNERAKELGMNNTTFVNSSGLPDEGHAMSAYDVALMSRELLKHKDVHRWLTTWMDSVAVGRRQSVQELVNTNRLIRSYDGANGIKTGSTGEAGYCLSASATRGNTTFIAVVLGAPTSAIRFSEASRLLDYGFANFSTAAITTKNSTVATVPVQKGVLLEAEVIAKEDLKLLVKKGEEDKVKREVIIPQYLQAPIQKGEKIGEVIALIDGKEMGRVDIVAAENIERASLWDVMLRLFRRLTQ